MQILLWCQQQAKMMAVFKLCIKPKIGDAEIMYV